jgi:hypothetical protein
MSIKMAEITIYREKNILFFVRRHSYLLVIYLIEKLFIHTCVAGKFMIFTSYFCFLIVAMQSNIESTFGAQYQMPVLPLVPR